MFSEGDICRTNETEKVNSTRVYRGWGGKGVVIFLNRYAILRWEELKDIEATVQVAIRGGGRRRVHALKAWQHLQL